MLKFGLLGAGRRMQDTYVRIIRALGHDIIGFTTRTPATAERFSTATGIVDAGSIDRLVAMEPDCILLCVNHAASMGLLRRILGSGIPILVETPIEDLSITLEVDRCRATVGVLEQWPYLPLEQFKEMLYVQGVMKRPYLVQNDCRAFDYHAIAMLRTYMGRSARPTLAMGQRITTMLDDHDGKTGQIDSWEIGTVRFDGGQLLSHGFSYACKSAPFRSIQTLRAYSADGTVVTGRVDDRSNDYEIIDVEAIVDGKHRKLVVYPHMHEGEAPYSILSADSGSLEWKNPYVGLGFTDHDVATASHITRMESVVKNGDKVLYNIHDAVIDQDIMSAIKHACATNKPVGFR